MSGAAPRPPAERLRRRLERAAVREAVLVARLWRLYPEILDPEPIRQARVEARLRMANG